MAQARRRSTYDVRREDLARLFYDTTRDEMDMREPRTNDIATRAVLADALEERGMKDLADRLRRFPARGRFFSSLLREKVRRAIFGPQKRQSFAPQKPVTDALLAYIPAPQDYRSRPSMWMKVTRAIHAGVGPRSYLLRTAYDGRYLVHEVRDEEEAIDMAQHEWPNVFPVDEDDMPADDFAIYRVGDARRARLLDDRGRAFVPNYGVVEFG